MKTVTRYIVDRDYGLAQDLNGHLIQYADFLKLKRGNTAILEALMDMCDQYLSDIDGDVCHHGYTSAGEQALKLLTDAGLAITEDDVTYTLSYEALEERKRLLEETK